MFQPRFDLDALGAMAEVDVLDLVSKHAGQLVFRLHQGQQAFTDEDVASRESEGVHEGLFVDVMKFVRQRTMGATCDLAADLFYVFGADAEFWSLIFLR